MDFIYEPISPASQNDDPYIIDKSEDISNTYTLYNQEGFYPGLYSANFVANSTTQTSLLCPKHHTPTTSNYTEDVFDISEFLRFSPNSGNSVKNSSGCLGPIRNKRTRVSYTRHQVGVLERAFKINPYLTAPRRVQLSKELKLGENQVKVWFQNRRCRAKKHDREEGGSAADNILPLDILSLASPPTPQTTIETAEIPTFLSSFSWPPSAVIQPIKPIQTHIPVDLPPTPSTTPTTTPETTPTATPITTPLATTPSGTECSELDEIMDFILESMGEAESQQKSIEEIQLDLELSAHIFLLSSQKNRTFY